MKKLLSYLKPYWVAVILAPLMMAFEVLTDLYQPMLMRSIINDGVEKGDIGHIVITGVMMVVVALAGILGGLGVSYFGSYAAMHAGSKLRRALFEKVQSFSFANLDHFQTGSLITRMTNDVNTLQRGVITTLRMMVRAPMLCIGGIIMSLGISLELAKLWLIAMPLMALSVFVVMKKGAPLFRVVQKKLDKVNHTLQENLYGVRVIKAFGRQAYEKERFAGANEELRQQARRSGIIMAMLHPFAQVVMQLTLVGVVWFGGIRIQAGTMQTGDVMSFIQYANQILFAVTMLSFVLMELGRSKASGERVVEVLEATADIEDAPDAPARQVKKGRLEMRGVSFRYKSSPVPVLEDISFTAEPGQMVAVLGSTGSGKTTLVSLIPRLYDVSGGQVLVDGVDVRAYRQDDLRAGIGMVLQNPMLFTGTIEDNIRWGKQDALQAEIDEAADAAQAGEFIHKIKDGYDTLLGQRGVNLSGGQKQRMSIARALVRKPKILILDDATSAVDMATEVRIQQAFRERYHDVTILLIAQRISSVMGADKILVLDEGRLVGEGTHEALLKTCEVYQQIVASQLGKEAV